MISERELNAHARGVARLPEAEREAEIARLTQAGKSGALRRIRSALREAARQTRAAEKEANKMTKSDWTRDDAKGAFVHAHGGGYKAVAIIPYTLKDKFPEAGKLPGAYHVDRNDWGGLKRWQTYYERAELPDLLDWYDNPKAAAPNVGVLCGTATERGYVVGVDVDCDAPEVLEGLAQLVGGDFAVRIGAADRSGLVPLIVDELGSSEVFTRGQGEAEETIQFLKAGKQFVGLGMHPKRMQLYDWQNYDATLDGLSGARPMPSVAELPRVKLADLMAVFEQAGFKPGGKGAVATNDEKQSAAQNIAESDLTPDDWEAVFGDKGLFPIDRLCENNPAFSRTYDECKDDDGDFDRESANVHTYRRHGTCKDFLREFGEAFEAQHFALFCRGWPGAGTYDEAGSGSRGGEFADSHLARGYAKALAELRDEWSGEAKQHASTTPSSNGEAFSRVDDGEDESAPRVKAEVTIAQADDDDSLGENVDTFGDVWNSPLADPYQWAVKNFIARGATYSINGTPGSGKTAVLLDVMLSVAAGFDWRGRKVEQGAVIFVALENPHDIRRRMKAWGRWTKEEGGLIVPERLPFIRHSGPLSLIRSDFKPKATEGERDLIELAEKVEKRFGLPVVAIVIDTVSQSIAPGNDREHAGLYTGAMKRIALATEAAVLAIHHPTKAGEALRGGSEFIGDVDEVILFDRDPKSLLGKLQASPQKSRIIDPNKINFTYVLRPYKLGVDADGEDDTVILARDPELVGGCFPAVEAEDNELVWSVSPFTEAAHFERLASFETLEDFLADDLRQRVAAAGDDIADKATFSMRELRNEYGLVLDFYAKRGKSVKGDKLVEQRRKQSTLAFDKLAERKIVVLRKRNGKDTDVCLLD